MARVSFCAGSSPRARGTLTQHHPRHFGRRFIPAGAGNMCLRLPHSSQLSVHPRGRGEHTGWRTNVLHMSGSSPRARGTSNWPMRTHAARRFIPAGAGNITGKRPPLKCSAVHPRGRGEHLWVRGNSMEPDGSSPRARGTWNGRLPAGMAYRFIPAGAGNMCPTSRSISSSSVHPRGRGEHPLIVLLHRHGLRFIPAGAGNI